jgi:hypothetical protein
MSVKQNNRYISKESALYVAPPLASFLIFSSLPFEEKRWGGREVKGLGRGHIQRIKENVRKTKQ